MRFIELCGHSETTGGPASTIFMLNNFEDPPLFGRFYLSSIVKFLFKVGQQEPNGLSGVVRSTRSWVRRSAGLHGVFGGHHITGTQHKNLCAVRQMRFT